MGDLFWRWLCTITSSYVFHLLKEKKIFFFQFYLMCQNFSIVWAAFLPPLLRGVLIFLLFGFSVWFFFLAMLHLPKHAGSSVIFLGLALRADFRGSSRVGGCVGTRVCMALSVSVYCTFLSFDSIAKPVVFFRLPFDLSIPNIPRIITVFPFQWNAFLRHSHPPPREGKLRWKSATIREN